MLTFLDHLARGVLYRLDPETGHALALRALAVFPFLWAASDPAELAVEALGLRFSNPLGTAAGFDKNGEAVDAVPRAGFGFAEVGTVTPLPQEGNSRPRLFRLPADRGVINRMGFNNHGHAAMRARLARTGGIVGVNLGANKDSSDRAGDYAAGISAFAAVASYFAVNVSSPNTPRLRDLQQASALDELLARVMEAREGLVPEHRRPVLLKIAPDLALGDLDDIVEVARRRCIDGMIISNTTVTRPPSLIERRIAEEAGGLSGPPVFRLSTRMLAETFIRAEGAFPLVGVGGIDSGETAWAKIGAGATLIQLYTGLVYRGFGLVREIKQHLSVALRGNHLASIAAAVGRDARAITAEPWPD